MGKKGKNDKNSKKGKKIATHADDNEEEEGEIESVLKTSTSQCGFPVTSSKQLAPVDKGQVNQDASRHTREGSSTPPQPKSLPSKSQKRKVLMTSSGTDIDYTRPLKIRRIEVGLRGCLERGESGFNPAFGASSPVRTSSGSTSSFSRSRLSVSAMLSRPLAGSSRAHGAVGFAINSPSRSLTAPPSPHSPSIPPLQLPIHTPSLPPFPDLTTHPPTMQWFTQPPVPQVAPLTQQILPTVAPAPPLAVTATQPSIPAGVAANTPVPTVYYGFLMMNGITRSTRTRHEPYTGGDQIDNPRPTRTSGPWDWRD